MVHLELQGLGQLIAILVREGFLRGAAEEAVFA
jgi:hypothetical protein